MGKEPLTKKQRDSWTSLSIGIIGGAYVLIADKLGAIVGLYVSASYGIDETFAGSACSILLSLPVIGVGFYHYRKAQKKC